MPGAPTVEIFSIGTELVMGRIQDTNAFWIAQELVALGAAVHRITVLPDDLSVMVEALRQAVERHTGVVITSGGLGPTPDDLTVQALCALTGDQPAVHEPTLDAYVQRRNLSGRGELNDALRRMATVPAQAKVYQNPAGWAPCVSVTKAPCTFFALPGPPQEMQAVFTMYLTPYFTTTYPFHAASLRVAVNMYESELAPLFALVRERFPSTYLKGYIALGGRDTPDGMPLDVVARSAHDVPAETILQQAVSYLSELVAAQGRTLKNV